MSLNQFLGLKEALEMLHLPNAGEQEDEGLSDGPPQDALVGALARHAETLLSILRTDRRTSEDGNQDLETVCVVTDPLIVLLLLDLLHLVQELSHAQLQLRQLVLGCDFRVVIGVFSHLDVQMDSLEHQETGAGSETGPAGIYTPQL